MASEKQKVALSHLNGSYYNHLSFAVDNNPRGVYDFIQANYPGAFDLWADGVEQNDNAKGELLSFLDGKAQASGNPDQFTVQALFAIPYIAGVDNWTNITS